MCTDNHAREIFLEKMKKKKKGKQKQKMYLQTPVHPLSSMNGRIKVIDTEQRLSSTHFWHFYPFFYPIQVYNFYVKLLLNSLDTASSWKGWFRNIVNTIKNLYIQGISSRLEVFYVACTGISFLICRLWEREHYRGISLKILRIVLRDHLFSTYAHFPKN